MSDYFREARLENITLNHPNFSSVQGDQHNQHNHISTMIVTTNSPQRGFRMWKSKQEAEFEQVGMSGFFVSDGGLTYLLQYNEIKRGDIRLLRDICSHISLRYQWRRGKLRSIECEKKFFVGEVVAGTGQGMKLTVVGYEGRDAQKEWLRDFKQYSRTL
ncbi:hypothetical protein V5O48_010159 [Marasmius crinis-equi]|uniref:Uncharacterized protein n=1 Tax=Marasmius crinis-equi TaxID=585013 RepID=A0ABR3F974_9AGAR